MKKLQYAPEVEEDDGLIPKALLKRCLRQWPAFLVSAVVFLTLGFLYMRYMPPVYSSAAKIMITKEAEKFDIASKGSSGFSFDSDVNLKNETAILQSFRLLNQVVEELDLDVSCYDDKRFQKNEIWPMPFWVTKRDADYVLNEPAVYTIRLNENKIQVTDENENLYNFPIGGPPIDVGDLPFHISLAENTHLEKNVKFKLVLWPRKMAVNELSNNLLIEATDKKSEVLSLSIQGANWAKSEAILNTIIHKFEEDGIADRQSVSKRTLEFIDERFVYLSRELDSIEIGKQDFKQDNSLSYIQEDATFALRKKSNVDKEVADIQTQISLSQLLKKSVIGQEAYSLLPSNIGVESSNVNALVSGYNDLSLQRSKLLASVGGDHPSLQLLNRQMEQAKNNILRTVEVFANQLETSLKRLNQERSLAGHIFSELPEKEKTLRSIERQQGIKENLFLLLLKKREEAAINHAVSVPSFKVVDFAVTANKPVSPRSILIYPMFFALGLLVPSGVIYTRFAFDDRVYNLSDIVKKSPNIPVISEIPFFKKDLKIGLALEGRSVLTESFRILSTNTNYHLSKESIDEPKVIYVTSAVKGEGKTFIALNLSLAYAGLKKRVLLVNADLRSSRLHSYFEDLDDGSLGLSDYLHSPVLEWERCIHEGYGKSKYHKICPHGTMLDNPPELLSNSNYERFLNRAKKQFDYIIVDTAPTLLITDTLLISKYADATLCVVRAGFTEKRLLQHPKDLESTKKLKNVAYVLNNAGGGKNHGYNYGYGYGYK